MKPNTIFQGALILLSLGFLTFIAVLAYQRTRVEHLAFAAGSRTGESYIIGSALKTVVERHYPRIRIDLVETGGSVENLDRIEKGYAALATAQADVPAGPSARMLAVLYDDTFQLLTRTAAPIRSFPDLRGRTVALA